MVSKMNEYNQSLSAVQIEFMGEPLPLVEYKRSFSGDLFHGGRLFVHGGGIQLLPEEYRLEHITINGEKQTKIENSMPGGGGPQGSGGPQGGGQPGGFGGGH